MKKSNVSNVFDLVSGVRLQLNESKLTLTMTTVEYSTNEDGTPLPQKFQLILSGIPDNYLEEAAYSEFRRLQSMVRFNLIFIHGKNKWRKLRHDLIIWMVETYYKYDKDLNIKFRAIPVKGDKEAYERIENAFINNQYMEDNDDDSDEVEDILDLSND